jgi:hypothetical protein
MDMATRNECTEGAFGVNASAREFGQRFVLTGPSAVER